MKPASTIFLSSAVALLASRGVEGHGHITWPPARNNGSLELAGNCENGACFWFSQPVTIPGKPTLPEYARTFNLKVSSGMDDFTAEMPWRAPGAAPVFGSGCGTAGGGPVQLNNGGQAMDGWGQGEDFLNIPATKPTVWPRGQPQEVAHALFANHGGGYSWRLCKKGSNVSEDCFGKNTLSYVGDKQWIRYGAMTQWGNKLTIPDVEIAAVRVTTGTHPTGSIWTRNPVPGCLLCNQAECMRNHTSQKLGDKGWEAQQHCSQSCSGLNITGRTCPQGMSQFPEPASGISGYYAQNCMQVDDESRCDGLSGFNYNVVDTVVVPSTLPTGEYLLSWRWDCEQSKQIWQNCADVVLV